MTDDQLKPLSEEIERIAQTIKNREDQIQLLAVQQKADAKKLSLLQEGLEKMKAKAE